MQTANPRYVIPRAQDNGPTPERAVKSVFTRGNPPRVLTTVQSLLNAGDISQDDANAGERWYRDYIFAYEGIIEFPENHVSDTTVRHDDLILANDAGKCCGAVVRCAQGIG